MNRFLAGAVGIANALVAGLIIAVGTLGAPYAQARLGLGMPHVVGATIVGALASTAIAVLVCGFLAVVIDMRNTLRQILDEVRQPVPTRRAEPTLQ